MRILSGRRKLAVYGAALLCLAFAPSVDVRAASDTTKRAPDFALIDQDGRRFTLSQHRGRPIVLFFGYTHCPDECPTILANLHSARVALKSKGSDLVVAMITVDPERDTQSSLRQFVKQFDPSFLGLRASRAELESVYRAYRIQFVKQRAGNDDYLVSHSAFVYYIGRDGRIRGFGTWGDSQPVLDEDLQRIVNSS